MQNELRSGVQRLASSLAQSLHATHASPGALNVDSADSALLSSVASQGGMVLRSLAALQAFRKAQQVCVCVYLCVCVCVKDVYVCL